MARTKETTPEQIRKEQVQEGRAMATAAEPPTEASQAQDYDSDEIPSPPDTPGTGAMPGREGTPGAGDMTVPGAGNVPQSLLDSIKDRPEHMPAKVFHFRLESFSGLHEGPKAHYYKTKWVCQEEPWTGFPVYPNIMWASKETIDAAMAGDPDALKNCHQNMREGKKIMQRAKWHNNDLGAFLASHPEMRLRLRIKEKQSKVGYRMKADGTEEAVYAPSKKFGNEVDEFLPLT